MQNYNRTEETEVKRIDRKSHYYSQNAVCVNYQYDVVRQAETMPFISSLRLVKIPNIIDSLKGLCELPRQLAQRNFKRAVVTWQSLFLS